MMNGSVTVSDIFDETHAEYIACRGAHRKLLDALPDGPGKAALLSTLIALDRAVEKVVAAAEDYGYAAEPDKPARVSRP